MKRRLLIISALVVACFFLFVFKYFRSPQQVPVATHTEETTTENSPTQTPPAEPSETPTTNHESPEVRTPPSTPATPTTPSKPQAKKLVIYIEKSPIPKAWLEEWNKEVVVEQKLIIHGQETPTDGDLYAISPRVFNELRGRMEFAKYESNVGLDLVNPAFTGQSFDPDNDWTRPWRWTPYFIFVRSANATAKPALPQNLWKAPGAIWTSDVDWLTALKMKESGSSANLIKSSNWSQLLEQVEKDISGHSATEEECWQAIRDGNAQVSYLPAALRLKPPIEDPANLGWFSPAKGTLVQFDSLAISRNSAASETALSLVKFLLQISQQQKMIADTGYYPVKSKPGHAPQGFPTSLPPEVVGSPIMPPMGAWFGSAEFLLKPSVETISKAQPVSH